MNPNIDLAVGQQPDIGYSLMPGYVQGTDFKQYDSMSGNYLGIPSVAGYVYSGDPSTADRIWVCPNSKGFDPRRAIPMLPGDSLVLPYHGFTMALRSYPDATQPPAYNTTVSITLEVAKKVGVQRGGLSNPSAPAPGATSDVNIAKYGGTATGLGQKVMAQSIPVTLASDQGGLPENLAQVGGAAIALGQTTKAASLPVTLASNQGDLATNLDEVGGAAVTLGQKAMVASIPVVLASDQAAIPVTGSFGSTIHLSHYRNGVGGTIPGVLAAANDVHTGACDLYGYSLQSTDTATGYVHFYDRADHTSVVLGTDIPLFTIGLLAGAIVVDSFPNGIHATAGLVMVSSKNFDGTGGAPANLPVGACYFL